MINMDSGTVGGLESGGGEAVAGGDSLTVVDNTTPTPVTVVNNSDLPSDVIPIPQDTVDNSTPTTVTVVNNSDLPANVIPIPQDTVVAGSTDSDEKTAKNLQIAINFSGVELGAVTSEGTNSVQVSISFGFSNLKGQSFKIDCTTSVPISSGTSADSGGSGNQSRISSGGGGKTH